MSVVYLLVTHTGNCFHWHKMNEIFTEVFINSIVFFLIGEISVNNP